LYPHQSEDLFNEEYATIKRANTTTKMEIIEDAKTATFAKFKKSLESKFLGSFTETDEFDNFCLTSKNQTLNEFKALCNGEDVRVLNAHVTALTELMDNFVEPMREKNLHAVTAATTVNTRLVDSLTNKFKKLAQLELELKNTNPYLMDSEIEERTCRHVDDIQEEFEDSKRAGSTSFTELYRTKLSSSLARCIAEEKEKNKQKRMAVIKTSNDFGETMVNRFKKETEDIIVKECLRMRKKYMDEFSISLPLSSTDVNVKTRMEDVLKKEMIQTVENALAQLRVPVRENLFTNAANAVLNDPVPKAEKTHEIPEKEYLPSC